MKTWKVLACERVRLLKRQIARLEKLPRLAPQCKRADLDAQKFELQQVEDVIAQPRSSLADWWSGDRINEVWIRLHDVEEALDEMTPDDQLDNLAWTARRHITDEQPANPDTLRAAIADAEGARQAWWRRRKEPTQVRRAAMAAIEASHGAANLRHLNERRLRRASYGWGLGLLLAAGCLVGVQAFFNDTVVPRPEGSPLTPWVLLTLICVFAALGAVLSAMASLYLNDTFAPTLWYDGRPSRAVLKVGIGVWTGTLGVIAVGTGVIDGTYGSLSSVLLLATIFGFGQETVTAFIDKRAGGLAAASG